MLPNFLTGLCMRIVVHLLAMLLWLWAVPVQAQETAPADRPVKTVCSVGVYLMDIYNVDTRAKLFGSNIWAWSVCTGEKDAIKSADWINSQEQVTSLEYKAPTDVGLWSAVKIEGNYRKFFDVRNYPFDRHTLRMVVEDGVDNASALKYVVDDLGSAVSPNLRIDGWDVTRFAVEASEVPYETTFGDPTNPKGRELYPHLEIVIDIKRSNLWTFWKLVAPLYVASAIILLTFLMHDKKGEYLTPRLSILAGVLFAIVINMRAVEEVVGETNGLSLMDNIHLIALFVALMAIAAATAWNFLIPKGWSAERVVKWDRRLFLVSTVLYIAANAVLIGAAVQSG